MLICAQSDFTDVPNSQIRKITAQRLLESKTTVPHYYLTIDINADKLLALRSALNEKLAPSGGKLSVNDFIIKASALVRRAVHAARIPCQEYESHVQGLMQSATSLSMQHSLSVFKALSDTHAGSEAWQ